MPQLYDGEVFTRSLTLTPWDHPQGAPPGATRPHKELAMEAIQDLLAEARKLIMDHQSVDEEDVSWRADERRAQIEQAAFAVLCQLVQRLV